MSNTVAGYYKIADTTYRVSLPAQKCYPGDAMLTPFRIDPCNAQRLIDFTMVDTLPIPHGERVFTDSYRSVYRTDEGTVILDGGKEPYVYQLRQGNCTHVQLLHQAVPKYITVGLVMSAMELPGDLIKRGGFLLHASYIEHNGGAILFTAPSGTGKSTQAELWRRHRSADVLNGDRVAITVDDGKVFAWGVPFCGSSGISKNVTLPVTAIVSLSQAPRNTVSRLTGLAAFRQVWEGCTVNHWNRQDMSACMDLVSQVVQRVPVFHLACTPDQSAVDALDGAILELR